MGFNVGNQKNTNVYVGSMVVDKAYLGLDIVWQNLITKIIEIPYNTVKKYDKTKWDDYNQVTTHGVIGKKKIYTDSSGKILKEEIIQPATDEVITIGTKPCYYYREERDSQSIPRGKSYTSISTNTMKNGVPWCSIGNITIPQGATALKESGRDGTKYNVYQVKYYKDKRQSRVFLRTEIGSEPVDDQYVRCGY